MNFDVMWKSFEENSMIMCITSNDRDLILSGEKTVIVQRKIPSKQVIDYSIFKQKHPKVYLYCKESGVFGECYCELSFDNIDCENKYNRKSYIAYGKVDRFSRIMYKENTDKFAK